MTAADPAPGPAPAPERPLFATLPPVWQQWVAENRLRGCTPESMLETMSAAGLDRHRAWAAIHDIDQDPVYRAAVRVQQLHRKLESVASNLQRLWASAPGASTVEKRCTPSRDEFLERYVRGCRPVVLTDLTRDWPAMRRWTPAYLKQRYGAFEIEIQDKREGDARFEENKLAHRRRVRVGDFVDRVLAGGPTNDYYLTANNEALRQPEFAPLLDDVGTLPPICERSRLSSHSSFWFGPAGTVTPLHHDELMLFHTQVVGRKRWRFISPLETPRLHNYSGVFSPVDLDRPSEGRHPLAPEVTVLDVVVEPGETVFLPLAWWHQVRSLDVSISFSFSNLDIPNHFSYRHPSIQDW